MYSKTIVVGHLGRDPELRFTPSGQQVCSFSVATSRSWTDQSGQQQEKTTWLVLVEGEVDASAWTSQTGELRASLEINARNVRFLGGRDSVGGPMTARPSGPMEGPAIEEEDIPF